MRHEAGHRAARTNREAPLPRIGFDVNLLRRLALRLAADMPIFAGADCVVARSRLSARIVVGF